MIENKNGDKKRGGCLTTFLIVFMVFMAIGVIMGIFVKDNTLTKGAPSWAIIVTNIIRVLIVAGCVGTFLWKKWGVGLFAGGYAVLTFFNIFTMAEGLKTANLVGSLVGLVVVVGILIVLVKPVWKHMK